jgi:coenzyme F420-reducing hydrogenase delta subunit
MTSRQEEIDKKLSIACHMCDIAQIDHLLQHGADKDHRYGEPLIRIIRTDCLDRHQSMCVIKHLVETHHAKLTSGVLTWSIRCDRFDNSSISLAVALT